MMKIAQLAGLLMLIVSGAFAEQRSFSHNGRELFYHYLPAPAQKKGLLIFLHGSVKAFQGQAQSRLVPIVELLEGNTDLVSTSHQLGYDLIIPVAFNEYNWLESSGSIIIDTIVARHGGDYNHVFIAGFSDGGTGAYRYFYSAPARYAGVAIFNGYPQLQNFNRKINYRQCSGKPVIFMAQDLDKVVPYEFLLTEYRRQKLFNEHTYFRITKGRHEFVQYGRETLEACLTLLEPQPPLLASADSIWIFPPLDAYMVEGRPVELYTFRARLVKGYGMSEREYKAVRQPDFRPEAQPVKIYPLKIALADTAATEFAFPLQQQGARSVIKLPNYSSFRAW